MSHIFFAFLEKPKFNSRQILDKKLPATESYVLFSKIAVKSPESKVFDKTIGCGYQLVSIPSYGLKVSRKGFLSLTQFSRVNFDHHRQTKLKVQSDFSLD